MQKKLLLTAAAVAIVGTTLVGATQAFAQSNDTSDNPRSSLVERIANKFGLQESEVQAVFDEARSQHQAEMQQRSEERLSQLVSDGKITEEQKQLIISKRDELRAEHQSEHESMQDLTPEERRAAMDEHRQELEDWASQNGIDPQYLMPQGPAGMGRGMHGMR